jgi:hypothetical protein
MRSDQVMGLVGTVLTELESGLPASVVDSGPQGRLRRQRHAMVLENGIAELAATMPLPGFRGRLAWQLPSAQATPASKSSPEDDLARRACRIARRRFHSMTGSHGTARDFDGDLARLLPGAEPAEIRMAAFGGRWAEGTAINAPVERSRPAGARLLAALAVIAVGLRHGVQASPRQDG